MMLFGPFLVACIPGFCILLLTWWLGKKDIPTFIKLLPCLLTIVVTIGLFYVGFVNIRGFEGAGYGLLAIFLIIFALISLRFARTTTAS